MCSKFELSRGQSLSLEFVHGHLHGWSGGVKCVSVDLLTNHKGMVKVLKIGVNF